ncbi:hypothetical protein JKF63_05977 [Porcisia hertigi]|uniref:Uncharacterized protein n=1 Tax=Porcisia hertigi TaxID=2761500 RepID=A0A836I754_9TRYP|nr:hypothetical protein JKF63_05977 [Porcisia hertigi]
MKSRAAAAGAAGDDQAAQPAKRKDGTTLVGSSISVPALRTEVRGGNSDAVATPGSYPGQDPSGSNNDAAGISSPSAAAVKRPGTTSFRRSSTLQLNAASRSAGAPRGAVAGSNLSGAPGNVVAQSAGSGLCKPTSAPCTGSPNTRLRHPLGSGAADDNSSLLPLQQPQQQAVASGTSPQVYRGTLGDSITCHASPSTSSMVAGTRDDGAGSPHKVPSTLTSALSVSGLSNHLRLSEGLNCLDYHPSFRALAIGSTRQIHMVEVIPIVGHDVAAAVQQNRVWQQQQPQASTNVGARPDGEGAHAFLGTAVPSKPPEPPSPLGSAPFLLRNTGVFGGLIKVESVAWYPSTEEASLAFIQPARTVTIFLDAIQFKADGTYLPQQWTRSQYKGKTLTSAMAAGGGSTAMAVVANLDCLSGGGTPAVFTPSLGGGFGPYTPASTSLAGGPSFGVPSISHGSTPHDTNLSTPTSTGLPPVGLSTINGPHVVRNPKGPLAKELIELNIDITYMRVEKIVWDPHHPYTLALSSPVTHFELWQVPTDGSRVYAPQLVLRPPAHNTRSVVRDLVFSPSNPHLIVVATECGNIGQVLLYDRRQVEAMRRFDVNGPCLSAAFHPLFSDLLAVCFRSEKTKPDTRISFLRVVSGNGTAPAWFSRDSPSATASAPTASPMPQGGSLAAPSAVPAAAPAAITGADTSCIANVTPANTSPYLAEQPYLPPIDNYACISRMQWRPPSMGRLMEPKQHHYMTFKPSAQALCVACNSPNSTVPSAEGTFTWADLLHSQLWFASAAMTTDTDLSIWDAANGFFPVCVVKYLSPRGDTTPNESNDFVWLNELTLVTVFKSGDVVCTSFVNSLLEGSVMTSAERVQLRAAAPHQQQQLQQQRQRLDPEARDELGELYSTRIAEEEMCLAMLPEYVRDPYADLFTTFTVLPTTSIVSDLFGHSYTIRSTNAALRRSYHQMIRRDCGQLVRRLAIQVSREAVLREQWTKMRSQFPAASLPTGPGMASGRAALQEHRSRRPCSPFIQTSGAQGQTTSSQGSDSTPPSPRRSMLSRHYSAGTSLLSMGTRQTTMAPLVGGRTSNGSAGTRRASGSGCGTVADATGLPQRSPLSLEDVSEVGMTSSQNTRAPRRHTVRTSIGGSATGASHDAEMADPLTEDTEATGHGLSPYPELTRAEAAAAAVAVDDDVSRSPSRTSSATTTWIRRLFGISRREGRSRYREKKYREQPGPVSLSPSRVKDAVAITTAGDDNPADLTRVLDVSPGPSFVPPPDHLVAPASALADHRQPPPCATRSGGGDTNSLAGSDLTTPTITISTNVTNAHNCDISCGSPRQGAPIASPARVRAAAASSFPAYCDASTSAITVASPTFFSHYERISSGRGGVSTSSLPHVGSSFGVCSSAPSDLDRVSGGIASHRGTNTATTRVVVPFTQLFPLLEESVYVHNSSTGGSGGGGGSGNDKVSGKRDSAEGQHLSRLSPRVAKTSAPPESVTTPSATSDSPNNSSSSPVAIPAHHRLPTVLHATTASPPLMIPPVESHASGDSALAAQRMHAHAYLKSKRDVTTALECLVLSDPVCHWSYTEKQAEQQAFVCFALEWDMGYELALAMKALRQKRADAATAAEVLTTSDGTTTTKAGPMPALQPRDADIPDSTPSSWLRGRGSGHRQGVKWGPKQQTTRGPDSPQTGGTSAGKATGRAQPCLDKSGTRIPSQARSRGPSTDPARMCDWGNGVPVPSHEDVDDKIAAMMEENARICERVLRERRGTGGAGSEGRCAHTNQPRPHGGDDSGIKVPGSVGQLSEDAATTTCDAEGEKVNHSSACDPRAQWWRAAAHSWRSHHVSFIISITAQQLEYAALMGDVQYSLVLYILFCLWWRLHSEVAEAAYAMALEAQTRCHGVGNSSGDPSGGGEHDRHQTVSPQGIIPLSDGRSGLSTPGAAAAAASVRLPDTALPLKSVSTSGGNDDGAKVRQTALHSSSDGTDSDEDHATNTTSRSLERLKVLSHLCSFFLQCPLMPASPGSSSQPHHHYHHRPHAHRCQSASIGSLSAVTRGSAELGNLDRNVSSSGTGSPSRVMLSSGGGGQGVVGSSGNSTTFLRASASTHSLPSRSQNNSSHRLNDTPTTPSMVVSVNGGRRAGASTPVGPSGGGTAATSSYRGQTLFSSPQGVHRPGTNTNAIRPESRHGATTGGESLAALNEYMDVEGLRGVRLYSCSSDDESATPGYCTPEEWKIRALQWLETYTADLYARQLYVPINELLLIMPEIFREPTNPVQPRAADVAYEKQMTYVYCGTCSKAELWSRTQQETVPAVVRLYERVVRRGHHSSSSEETSDESGNDIAVSGNTLTAVGAHKRESRQGGRSKKHYEKGDDSSSVVTTPSVESPTSLRLSCHGTGLADGVLATPDGPDVSLSLEHSVSERAVPVTVGLHEADLSEEAVSGRELETDHRGSFASTTEGSHMGASAADGRTALHSPAAVLAQRPHSVSKSRPLFREQRNRDTPYRRSRPSRRSLEDADDGEESHLTRPAVDVGHPSHRYTAIGCDECNGNPTANNAACRRCHNREAMSCVICEEVVEGMFFWLRSCGHGGHVHHIEEWLRYSQECPKCGVPITQTWKGS